MHLRWLPVTTSLVKSSAIKLKENFSKCRSLNVISKLILMTSSLENWIPSSTRWSINNWCDNLVSRRPFIKWGSGKRLKFFTFLMFFSSKFTQIPFKFVQFSYVTCWSVELWFLQWNHDSTLSQISFEVPKCFYFLSCSLDSLPNSVHRVPLMFSTCKARHTQPEALRLSFFS